ncbi:collagen alpha-6(VI) chain isoform X2 [Clarias gariepinus]|uniref:collagen alpha-6(VI) chain isoform X2 n=1 Tax=Clarias gariepinus TaxID=13013 RepID=UPI00234C4640|nr:collagen alpha-6(VI) chain isoform X2 [Clarias gariepinus]
MAYKLIDRLSKMLPVVLFITGIYTTVGFTMQVSNFTDEDPLFGQTTLKSWKSIFFPCPSTGDVFEITEKSCFTCIMNVTGSTKVLRPITSVAYSRSKVKEQLMVCNHVWTSNSSTEFLNRKCTHESGHQEKSQIYPDKLVLQVTERNANNNNNKYAGGQALLHEGREIVFVLDGSDAIGEDDFERAKDFIYNLMNNIWRKCFRCIFAIVQYGRDIRTELSLQDNNDHLQALDKVKSIKRIQGLANIASALYHVLTNIFVPQHGSKENTEKYIILLSDGQTAVETRNFIGDVNMPDMREIAQNSLGVEQEMIKIAGSENRFFKVSNYFNMKNILSFLEKIISVTEDAGTEVAFVLDGSTSIRPEDFEMAKIFIHDVMKNIWTKYFSYKFAIVQYGNNVRTELSLQESNDHLRALAIVKKIDQIQATTMTASALYHVLTDVFVPQNGSKENSRKIIILLSDGVSTDGHELPGVLDMLQRKGIVRYAIGLKTSLVDEMTWIAGSKERFFKVAKYNALKNILWTLEKRIIGIQDAGIEIAFVLDGSGTTEAKDFEMAKDFIFNFMKNVQTTCFSCRFAVVQNGTTELSLKQYTDSPKALYKVKKIKQIRQIKTFPALYYVLTDVFVPQHGSTEKAKKVIIVLSDGQMTGDKRNLTEVLNMLQVEGIVCYAIGVGLQKNAQAIQEMTEIAGSKDHFFNVSNYADLKNIVSSLENSIIGIEDPGTEIVFVLDGSKSREEKGEDFEKAKDFMSYVMNYIWTTCFRCKFAAVQYGSNIRMELSLKENNNLLSALEKVKNIKQIYGITKTTSDLYYVLDVFTPQSGSKDNAKKVIILLSYGEKSLHPGNLTDVLNMPQMKGMVRYSIGVGPAVLNKPKAILDMTEIAGSEDRFFKISNYESLKNILSSLEKSIIGIEGKSVQPFCLA